MPFVPTVLRKSIKNQQIVGCDCCNNQVLYVLALWGIKVNPAERNRIVKTIITVLAAVVLSIVAGCNKPLSVNFQKDQPLRYEFTSSRDIEIDWNQQKDGVEAGRNKTEKISESMDMTVVYTPIGTDANGFTIIKADCPSVQARRNPDKLRQQDAVTHFAGRTFTLTVDRTGKMRDASQLGNLIREVGKQAFRQGSKQGRIKEPDMINDFVASQWFLWDSISSLGENAKEPSVGQSWKSKLSVTTPMVSREGRDVVYTLGEIRQTKKGAIAVIRSSYSLAKSVPNSWPMPYSGSFQMSGTFGFLRSYNYKGLQGEGEELFNIDTGRTEQYNQTYKLEADGSLPMAVGTKPMITITQKLSMKLVENR